MISKFQYLLKSRKFRGTSQERGAESETGLLRANTVEGTRPIAYIRRIK